jgi:ligand-binding SRPBCC domain-containing protein
MQMHFIWRSEFKCSPQTLFAFHERADVLPLLTPPWAPMEVEKAAPNLHVGAEAHLKVRLLGPLRVKWLARHTVYEPPHRFVDEQIRGPFKKWRHEHRIEETANGARLIDDVDYILPLGPLGWMANGLMVRRQLKRMFAYRHAVTRKHVER